MASTIVLTEVSPFSGDTWETVAYRHCDECSESCLPDVWADLSEEQWRRFYEIHGEGLVVCEACLEGVLKDAEP